MEYIKRTKEEIEKWIYLGSHRVSGGSFYKYNIVDSQENNLEDTFFKNEFVLEYYKVLKNPVMGSFREYDKKENNIFESMIKNNEIELIDTYIIRTLSWSSSELNHNKVLDELLKEVSIENDSFNKHHKDHLINGALYSLSAKMSLLNKLKRNLTKKWGYFNQEATLEEQELFVENAVDQLRMEWIEQNGEDTNNFNPKRELESLNSENSFFYILSLLKAKGSKLSYL